MATGTGAAGRRGTLWDQLNAFQAMVGQAQKQAPNPKDRQILGELLEQIQASQAEVQEKLPALLEDLNKQAQTLKAEAEAAREELAQAIKKTEELEKLAVRRAALEKQALLPKPKVRPAAAIDPELGQHLRASLLGKLDQAAAGPQPTDPLVKQREAWQDWEGFESRRQGAAGAVPAARPTSPAPPAAAAPVARPAPLATPVPPAATPVPAANVDDDVWQGLSRAVESTAPTAEGESVEEDPVPPPPAPPPRPRKPPAKPKAKQPEDDADDDLWKGLSKLR